MFASAKNYLKHTTLIREMNDTDAEKVCGGAMTTPEIMEENSSRGTPTKNTKIVPSPAVYNNLGLTPFFPSLPATKLPRLESLDASARNAPTNQNALTITIPLPSSNLSISN